MVDDTSPQLGGDLDANGNNIKIDGGNKLLFQGDTTTTNNFLEYNTHYSQSQLLTDSNFTISVGGSNQFSVGSGGVCNPSFLSSIIADPDGSVDLFYNDSKKFETTSSGIQTTGTVNVNGAYTCLLYTSPSPRDRTRSRMPSSA